MYMSVKITLLHTVGAIFLSIADVNLARPLKTTKHTLSNVDHFAELYKM